MPSILLYSMTGLIAVIAVSSSAPQQTLTLERPSQGPLLQRSMQEVDVCPQIAWPGVQRTASWCYWR